jgi:hypothetical protein
MIDAQSPAIVKSQSHLTAILPLPAGEGRGEGESLEVESSAAYGQGELCSHGRQSALIKVGEPGTRPYSRAVPFDHSAILSKSLLATFHVVPHYLCLPRFTWWQKFTPQSIVKFALLAPEIPNPGQIQQSYPSLSKPLPQRGEIARMGSLQLFAHFSEKKGLFLFLIAPKPWRRFTTFHVAGGRRPPPSASLRLCAINYPKSTPAAKLTPLQTLSGPKAGRFKPMQGKK